VEWPVQPPLKPRLHRDSLSLTVRESNTSVDSLDNDTFFVLDASEGLLRKVAGESQLYRLTLREISREGMYFSDRPVRDSGRLRSGSIVSIIEKEIKRGEGVNFAISYDTPRGIEDIETFTLEKIRISRSGDEIIGLATPLREELGAGDFLTQYQNASDGEIGRKIQDVTAVFTPARSKTDSSSTTINSAEDPIAFDFGLGTVSGEVRRVSGEQNTYQLKAKVAAGNIVYLSEYPYRKTGLIPVEDFADNWQAYGFDRVPPNASIFIAGQGSTLQPDLNQAVTITKFRYNEDSKMARLRFEPIGDAVSKNSFRKLLPPSSAAAKAFGSASIFIDSVSYQYILDPVQAVRFNAGTLGGVGLIRSFGIGSTSYAQDLTSSFSLDGQSGGLVSGFLESIAWSGSALDPITATFLVSNANMLSTTQIAYSGLTNPTVSLDFSVYEYDPALRKYYEAFASAGPIVGQIVNLGGNYSLNIDTQSYSQIPVPLLFSLSISFSPLAGALPSEMVVAHTANGGRAVQWG